jgi:hypothetical protein
MPPAVSQSFRFPATIMKAPHGPEGSGAVDEPPADPVYQPNPKHKEPWQPGRKGSLCPKDLSLLEAARLLKTSLEDGESRWATANGRAFRAKQHAAGKWHGWPVAWGEVPAGLRIQWVREGVVSRKDISRFWRTL